MPCGSPSTPIGPPRYRRATPARSGSTCSAAPSGSSTTATLHLLERGTAVHFNAELPHRLGAEKSAAEVLLVAAKPTRNLHTIH